MNEKIETTVKRVQNTNRLETLAEKEAEHVKHMMDSDPDHEEIASIKTGYEAIVKALESTPDDVVCLLDWHTNDDPVIVGHPDLADNDSYDFSKFYSKISRNGTEIWVDKYWESSPGSNQIHLYELPAADGGVVKLAVWTGAGWDYPEPFMLATDLNRRLK